LTEENHALRAGVWDKSAMGAHEMRGRTLGIIGYANIGSQLSVLAEALGMLVVYFDTADRPGHGPRPERQERRLAARGR
jgi:D-3-phosphoglycerate dehydrogenase / 2-oxoglutarate reductase